ncbi:hypothetical protein LTR70_008434 [Exophiala xenobiotica]|uniref:Uncharacterized protein n=1 Tax=Lithohypha guttulata TaxID=1690604 RepID=A0ABR0K141_9EURO|nr:hypothetical protein LTR24_008088 [Lithohypha guttulata]KAK5312001.1 hypothetical protein LTR70_008434 [Exophiala xenobiotica]
MGGCSPERKVGRERRYVGNRQFWTGSCGPSGWRSRVVAVGKTNVVDRPQLAWVQIDSVQVDGKGPAVGEESVLDETGPEEKLEQGKGAVWDEEGKVGSGRVQGLEGQLDWRMERIEISSMM